MNNNNMNNNNMKNLLILALSLVIVYFIQKIVSKQYSKVNPQGNSLALVNAETFEDGTTTTEATTTTEPTIGETEYNDNAETIGDLLNFYNNTNTNYYNEDNTDLTRLVKQVNKVFKYLNPEQRINLSKRKLDEVYLEDLKREIDNLTDNTTMLNNKILNTNTGIAFDTILNGDTTNGNIRIKIENDDGENECLEYDTDTTNKVLKCDNTTSQYLDFKRVPINTPQDFNNNLHPDLSFVKIKDDTIPYSHSIIQTTCDDCDDCINDNDMFAYDCNSCGTDTKCIKCCKKYKKCLTVVKNTTNSGYTTFVEECNGRSAQQFL
jgi:hypothetical protein